jgi:hypothetical protein
MDGAGIVLASARNILRLSRSIRARTGYALFCVYADGAESAILGLRLTPD